MHNAGPKEKNDYLVTSVNIGPKGENPSAAASLALAGKANIQDNYGNMLVGRQLFSTSHGEMRVYSLDYGHWSDIGGAFGGNGITHYSLPADDLPRRTDHKILIPDHEESPLNRMVHRLEAEHAPYQVLPLPAARGDCPSR